MKIFFTIALFLVKLSSFAQQAPIKSFFNSDSATYKGIISGYTAQSGNHTGMVYINNIFKGIQESSLIRIAKDGSFSAKFLMHYPQDVFVSFLGAGFKGCSFSVYMEPGKTVTQSFDPVKLDKGVNYPASIFSGDLARINKELALSRDFYHQITYSKDEVKSNSLFFEDLLVNRIKGLMKYKDSIGLSEKTFNFLRSNIKLAILTYYTEYINDTANVVSSSRLAAFAKFLASQALNEETNVISASYKYLINRLQYSKIIVPEMNDQQWLEVMQSMPTAISFSPNEKVELSKVVSKSQMITFYNSHPQYTGEMNSYFFEKSALRQINEFKLALGIADGLMLDLMRVQILSQMLEDFFTPFSEKKLTELNAQITHPFLRTSLQVHNQEIKAKIGANKTIAKKTNVEEILKWEEILAKFKGKVIHIDFWATWCGPCREGIAEIAPLKEELKDQNVAFVYVTNQSSPLETYQNMVPAIKGNHFRLSNDEWNVISAKFKIGSIPHYMLIGKDGLVINDNLLPLKNEALKEKLLTATKF